MQTTYHLSPAPEIPDIIESIISAFKSKAITVTVEDGEDGFDITDKMMGILAERLLEDDSVFLTAEQSIKQLKSKYGV